MSVKTNTKPYIASIDLEISPMGGWFYPPLYETRILKVQHRQYLMSFAWQDVSKKKVHSLSLADMPNFSKDPRDDRELVIELHKVLSDADIILGHNSDRFDLKMANYFFIMHDLDPIPLARSIDTLKVARKHFKFASNSLDSIATELGVGSKTKTTVGDLWVDCFLKNDIKAYGKLKTYNRQDVRITTGVYLKMRGWMNNHPNMTMYTGDYLSCPTCGSYSYSLKANRVNNTNKYKQYACHGCRGYFTDRQAIKGAKPIFK